MTYLLEYLLFLFRVGDIVFHAKFLEFGVGAILWLPKVSNLSYSGFDGGCVSNSFCLNVGNGGLNCFLWDSSFCQESRE